jgi:hypothetical protein
VGRVLTTQRSAAPGARAAQERDGHPADIGQGAVLGVIQAFGVPGGLRALAVVLGGSVVLTLGAAAAVGRTVQEILGGRRPGALALAGDVGLVLYVKGLSPWMRRWGATDEELVKALPGDETVPEPGAQHTRAVTIDAPPEQVWPWLAQIGQDRGGFYSYDWLENLAGCCVRNTDRIHPQWQDWEVGDIVRLWPAGGLALLRFDPARAFAMSGGWYFAMEPHGDSGTRLIARWRPRAGLSGKVFAFLLELPHFIMERRMLLGIKERAERASPPGGW